MSRQQQIADRSGQRAAGRPQAQQDVPVQPRRAVLTALAAAGVIGPVLFLLAAVVQGLLRPGYSFVAQPVVALVQGPSGWVQDLNFAMIGLLTIACAVGLHLDMRPTPRGVVGPALFGLSGIGPLWLAATEPIPVHFLLVFLSLAFGLMVMSRRMKADAQWRGLASYALGAGVAILVLIPTHSVLALPADGPLHAWWGLLNWSAVALWMGSTVVLASRLLRVATSRPVGG